MARRNREGGMYARQGVVAVSLPMLVGQMIKRELTEEEAFEKRESGKHKNRNRVLELAGKSLGILGELLRSDFHSVILTMLYRQP